MNPKAIVPVLIFTLSLPSFQLFANDFSVSNGRVTQIDKNEKAPFEGVLFDPLAISTLLADIKQQEDQFKLELEFQKKELKLDYNLEYKKLELDYEFLLEKHKETVKIKNDRISDLELMIVEQPTHNRELWLGLGFGGGVVFTVIMYLLVAQTTN